MEERWWPLVERMVDTLAAGSRDPALRAALRLAVDFTSWRTLTASGLDDAAAAELAATLVAAAAA